MEKEKIISLKDFAAIRRELAAEHQVVVLCHGVFDLLHYGHIEHLKDAKKQGDVLVVSVTAAKYVNKGPGRPYFSDTQRMAFLASLEIVDYVLLSEAVTVHNIVNIVQPDIYAKGKEYQTADNDITGNIGSEKAAVEQYGGKLYFTEGAVYSSTKLLNNFFAALSEDVMNTVHRLKDKYGGGIMTSLRQYVDSFAALKVLVVGDVILDKYVFCNVQGLTMKDAVLSTFFDYEECYAGGALAIAKHLADFSSQVAVCSMIGANEEERSFIEQSMYDIKLELIIDEKFVTPEKKRFLKQNSQRQEFDKLFSINRLLKPDDCKYFDYTKFHERLEKLLPQYDLVVVCDYGHGLLDEQSIELIEKNAKFLTINCQTNSANYGTNLITKYQRADSFVTDERELHFAFGQALVANEILLAKLAAKLEAGYAWVTVGAKGAIGNRGQEQNACPALLLKVKDTIGAGDAFYALAALCARQQLPLDMATLIANAAGALKSNVVGNKEAVHKVDLLKFLNMVLNV